MISGLPYYVWEVPGKAISIQLPFDVIDRMSPEILRGFGALKRRGAEVGGILLGRFENGPRRKVIIEDFEAVPSEYLNGPSYNLSDNDLTAFRAALERRQSDAEQGLAPIGFYRSHTRDELYMDDADLGLASRFFPGPENVFLLIKPFASRPSVGGFFFWEEGEIYRESSYLQFPFHRKELGGGETPRPAPPPRAEAGGAPLPPYTPLPEGDPASPADAERLREAVRLRSLSILDASEPRGSRRLQWRWLLVPGFLAIAAVAGFVAYRNLDSSKAAESSVSVTALPLKLSVAEKQNQLDVTWDRNAPAIASAKRGVLSISDGSNRRDLDLSGAQLRNGRVLYSRLSADVNLRLEVFPEGSDSVSESIRIVSTDAPKEEAPPQAPAEAPAPRKRPVTAPKSAPRVPAVSTPSPAAAAPPSTTPAPAAAPAEVELQRPKRRR